jgi:AraC family transcriptional regulator
MMLAGGRAYPLTLDRARPEPLLNSANTPWAGLPLEEHRIVATERRVSTGPLDGEHGILTIMEGRIEMVVRQAGRDVTYPGVPSSVSLLAGDHRRDILRIDGGATAVAVHVPRAWFQQLSLDGAPAGFGLGQPLQRDATAYALVRAMRDEIAGGATTGRIFAESLSLALLSYVVERLPGGRSRVRGSLSEGQCRQLRRYVRERLHEELSLAELAALVGLSPRYFSRLFQTAFDTTPHRYVMQERLAEGARQLARGRDVLEVALALGFCSQSHFTAAFRQAYGLTPRRYAAQKRIRAAF